MSFRDGRENKEKEKKKSLCPNTEIKFSENRAIYKFNYTLKT